MELRVLYFNSHECEQSATTPSTDLDDPIHVTTSPYPPQPPLSTLSTLELFFSRELTIRTYTVSERCVCTGKVCMYLAVNV